MVMKSAAMWLHQAVWPITPNITYRDFSTIEMMQIWISLIFLGQGCKCLFLCRYFLVVWQDQGCFTVYSWCVVRDFYLILQYISMGTITLIPSHDQNTCWKLTAVFFNCLTFVLDSLISVITGELGESVTFKCLFSNVEYSNTRIKWYKQTVGDTLTLITILMKATTEPAFEQGFSPSRFAANYVSDNSTLTILKTVKEDEALYHCAISTWKTDQWTGTFLTLKGNLSLLQ